MARGTINSNRSNSAVTATPTSASTVSNLPTAVGGEVSGNSSTHVYHQKEKIRQLNSLEVPDVALFLHQLARNKPPSYADFLSLNMHNLLARNPSVQLDSNESLRNFLQEIITLKTNWKNQATRCTRFPNLESSGRGKQHQRLL